MIMKPFKRNSPRSLGDNLALWFCLTSVALTLALARVIEVSSTAAMRDQIGQNLAHLAYQTTDKLDQGMFERYREMQIIATRPTLGDPSISIAEKQALLEQVQRFASYSWIGVTDLKGHVLAATGGLLVGADVSKRPWFFNALRSIHIGDVHDAKLLADKLPNPSGEPVRFVDVAFPYRDRDGRIVGVVGAHMSWKWAEEVDRSVITTMVAKGGIEGFIVAQDGTILLGPKNMIGSKLLRPVGGATGSGNDRSAVERWPDGKDYLVGFSRTRGARTYPGLGWSVIVRQDVSEAFAPVRELHTKVLWSGFAIALLFTLFGLVGAEHITRPLISLARAARELRLGRADTLGTAAPSYLEVNELAASMSSLVGNLQENQQALQDLNASLEKRVAERTKQLAASEARLRTITDSIPALIAYVDADQRYRFCNRTFEEWFHRDIAGIVGAKVSEVLGAPMYEELAHRIEGALQGHHAAFEFPRMHEGELQHLRIEHIPDIRLDGSVAGFYVLAHDITVSKNYQIALQKDLLTDALTGLPNRSAYLQHLHGAIARARRSKKPLAVMFLDVDRFKSINDTHGHETGDRVLIEFGRRLGECVRETDTVARLSGDEFVVLIENLNAPQADAARVAQNIVDAVRRPMLFDEAELHLSTSIGVALSGDRPHTAEDLVKDADSAMYEAKRAGRNQIAFHSKAIPLAA